MWSVHISLWATGIATLVIGVAGYRLVSVADEVADRTGAGEALIGATMLGALTSLADITAIASAAYSGFASMAISAAVGGIAVQTAFLAFADIALPKVNLEHAAASLPNIVSVAVLVLILSLVLIAALGPPLSFWNIHPATLLLFAAYGFGMRLVMSGHEHPMWQPRLTELTRLDAEEEEPNRTSWLRLVITLVIAGGSVALAGWTLSEAGRSLLHHLDLVESAVGAIMIGVSTSLPELVTSIAAVRRGALTLAVGGVIGGNAFDTMMVGMADIFYREGAIYQHINPQDLGLTAITIFMSTVLLLGLLLRQRGGPGNIGLESTVVLVAYAISVVVVSSEYWSYGVR
jgi:cation:H+ antiporter